MAIRVNITLALVCASQAPYRKMQSERSKEPD
jgi:hypothetical protein